MIMTSGDVRQAQPNANTAIELGLLMMKNDTSWRTNNASGNWFVNRGTNAGTCTLNAALLERSLPTPHGCHRPVQDKHRVAMTPTPVDGEGLFLGSC
jgi:hypothetical protein